MSLIFNWGTGGSEDSKAQDWTARLLAQLYSRWLVGALGLIIIGVGLAHGIKAWKATFRKYLAWNEQTRKWAEPVCKLGLIARGIVFIIIGGFLIMAAIHFNSSEARGLAGALNGLEAQAYGPILLGIVALGLIAFGIYSFIEAAYRRINPPDIASSARHVTANR